MTAKDALPDLIVLSRVRVVDPSTWLYEETRQVLMYNGPTSPRIS